MDIAALQPSNNRNQISTNFQLLSSGVFSSGRVLSRSAVDVGASFIVNVCACYHCCWS